MTVSKLAAALIAVFEGCRLTAYQDTGGVWTIGFGHTGPDVTPGLSITQDHADALLAQDSAHLLKAVEGKPLHEAAALVSFGYNCGAGALKRVMAGEANLTDFVRDRKKNVLPGLVRRRALEAALIESADVQP